MAPNENPVDGAVVDGFGSSFLGVAAPKLKPPVVAAAGAGVLAAPPKLKLPVAGAGAVVA